MTSKLDLSIAIIARNEEANIGRTLESIAPLASEIIVVDTGSQDKTVEIAESFGAKVFVEEWKGHIFQKNSALAKCSCKWVLSLDCDEVVSSELKKSIVVAVESDKYDGYKVNRKTHYLGKLLKYTWQPDKKLRLVKRQNNPVWKGLDPHDELFIDGTIHSISGDLVHYSYQNIKHHFDKTIDYAQISARSYFNKGRKFSFFNLLFNPLFAFIKLYFFNRAFIDGYRGLIAGFSTYAYTFLKYSFLYELELKGKDD